MAKTHRWTGDGVYGRRDGTLYTTREFFSRTTAEQPDWLRKNPVRLSVGQYRDDGIWAHCAMR